MNIIHKIAFPAILFCIVFGVVCSKSFAYCCSQFTYYACCQELPAKTESCTCCNTDMQGEDTGTPEKCRVQYFEYDWDIHKTVSFLHGIQSLNDNSYIPGFVCNFFNFNKRTEILSETDVSPPQPLNSRKFLSFICLLLI